MRLANSMAISTFMEPTACHAPDGRRQQWRERVSEQAISGD